MVFKKIFGLTMMLTVFVNHPILADNVKEPPLVSKEEVAKAHGAFVAWVSAYETGDMQLMWTFIHPRIQRWVRNKVSWRRSMRAQRKRIGTLSYDIEGIAPVTATQIPCTNMRHCYRKDLQYVFIRIRSSYEKVAPLQPEYVVMAKYGEEWKWGGGTFPDRFGGETGVILDRKDERFLRYKREESR